MKNSKITTNCFLIEDAIKYQGVDEAVFLYHIRYWVRVNEANESENHFKEGRYWTYDSKKALSNLFPFWTERQLARIVKNLVDRGALLTNTFNKLRYDQTTWYALTDAEKASHQMVSPSDQTVRPIPDSTTDTHKEDFKNSQTDNLNDWQKQCHEMAQSPGLTSDDYDFLIKAARYPSYGDPKFSGKQRQYFNSLEAKIAAIAAEKFIKVPEQKVVDSKNYRDPDQENVQERLAYYESLRRKRENG